MLKRSQVDVIAEEILIHFYKLMEEITSILQMLQIIFDWNAGGCRHHPLSHPKLKCESHVLRLDKDLPQRHQRIVFLRLQLEEILLEDHLDPISLEVIDLSAESILESSKNCPEWARFVHIFA